MLQKQNRRHDSFKEKGLVGVSIVLVWHTLQQGNVVSFQHDPPCETERGTKEGENQVEVDQKRKMMDGKRYRVSVHLWTKAVSVHQAG